MSERKVLNKYYPPDFDPTILPKLKLDRYRQYHIRTMAPFNMRCKTCGEFIYKGKKFNSRKETVKGEDYLGLEIYRFYIRCTRCLAEITYKTDPENTDYAIEHGATRNFEAETTARKMEDEKTKKMEEELIQNPMKILENRTKDSQREMEILENLEEIKEMNARNSTIDYDALLHKHTNISKQAFINQIQNDEILLNDILAEQKQSQYKRIRDEDSDQDENMLGITYDNNFNEISKGTCRHLENDNKKIREELDPINNINQSKFNQETSYFNFRKPSSMTSTSRIALSKIIIKKKANNANVNASNTDDNKLNNVSSNAISSSLNTLASYGGYNSESD
ncbi:unnamed protein product [Gordionus sp. m RMFG-2023]|uniref:splicing factor YJU2-like n=1 Tax=Gordionus sp. m RMFG-2023 TaxID=3053472 RepID=UPI0030E5BCB7